MPLLYLMQLLLKKLRLGKYQIALSTLLWFALAAIAVFLESIRGLGYINNFLIYKGVFWHTLHQQNLYSLYPSEYFDSNHYGCLFSLVIAPFALLPVYIGCFLWALCNAWILYYAIRQLPLSDKNKNIILLIGSIEMMTSIHSVEFNPAISAYLILTCVLVYKEKDWWATLFIMIGFLCKLYSIVGLCFFVFSKHKTKFVLSSIVWFVILFLMPMIISSPEFIIKSYSDWFQSLIEKNSQNAQSYLFFGGTDMSVTGIIRRITQSSKISGWAINIPAAILILLPLLRFSQYKNIRFQLLYLAVISISVVIFSSSAESPTYIIAVIGVAIWYVLQEKNNKWALSLMLFVLLITSLSVTDLFPRYLYNNIVKPYSLKVLPCFITWIVIILQLLRKNFIIDDKPANEENFRSNSCLQ